MSLWIDLDNSPHVHFFAPVLKSLEQRGIRHFVTVRSFSQTEELARGYGFDFKTIGKHHARRHLTGRVAETFSRALCLAPYARRLGVTASVSHNSRAMLLASCLLGIPALTLYDYEFVAAGFSNRFSRKVMVPSAISAQTLSARGLSLDKLIAYPGFKEEMYVYDFEPQADLLSRLNLDPTRLVITLRPPQTWAHYHNPFTDVLLEVLIRRLAREDNAQVLVLCRTVEQAEALRSKYKLDQPPFRVLTKAIDGLSLMWHSDAVFSGGGTMIREAALLGLNAYSIFASQLGAADAALEREGKLKMLRSPAEVEALRFEKSEPPTGLLHSTQTRDFICDQIIRFAEQNCDSRLKNSALPKPAPAAGIRSHE